MKIKNFIQLILAACIVFFAFRYVVFAQSSSFSSLDSQMSEEEMQRTGVYKLTSSERIELMNWVDKNYSPKRITQSRSVTHERMLPTISEVTSNGNFLKLDDGTIWQIYPADTPVTQGWLTPASIEVEYMGEGEYPYYLTNTITETRIRARKVTHVPERPVGFLRDLLYQFRNSGVGLNFVI